MVLSELIEKLKILKEKHGDLKILVWTSFRQGNNMSPTMSHPLIIALGGLKRSGKDTFAGILAAAASTHRLTPHRIAFAEPLRRAAAAAYDVPVAEFSGDQIKDVIHPDWGITRRQMLINVGGAMRGVDADHWTKLLVRGVDSFETAARLYTPAQKPLHIVTDLRRPNEAKALLGLGAPLVLVVRVGVLWDGHETEAMAGMATIGWHHGRRAARLGFPPPTTDPYRLVVENAFPIEGDASMIPAATAAFEKVANQLIDAVLSTARG